MGNFSSVTLYPRANGKSTKQAKRDVERILEAEEIRKVEGKQFAIAMAAIRDKYAADEEVCHIEMDELMCRTLSRLGFYEGVKIFEDTKKWYA